TATSRAAATWASAQAGPSGPWSALSRMRARASRWAAPVPLRMSPSSSARSSAVRVTRYTFDMGLPPVRGRTSLPDPATKINGDYPLGGVRLLGGAGLGPEPVVDEVQGAVVPPLVVVPPDGALGREVLGRVPPLAPGPEQVQDGVHDVP